MSETLNQIQIWKLDTILNLRPFFKVIFRPKRSNGLHYVEEELQIITSLFFQMNCRSVWSINADRFLATERKIN